MIYWFRCFYINLFVCVFNISMCAMSTGSGLRNCSCDFQYESATYFGMPRCYARYNLCLNVVATEHNKRENCSIIKKICRTFVLDTTAALTMMLLCCVGVGHL